MRLEKFAAAYAPSRKEIKKVIRSGRVSVNGIVVKNGAVQVDSERDIVELDGERIFYTEFIYLMMNKPSGVISATFDNHHKTVIDLLDEDDKKFNPFPVGRLDIDTEGLLLLTNDGKAAHAMLSPRKKVYKVYVAKVSGELSKSDVDAFKEGIVLDDGYKTKPAILEILSVNEAKVSIIEGKFHQVKRMFRSVSKEVLHLKRIEFAGIPLDSTLNLGEYRRLLPQEVEIVELIMQ